MLDLNKIEMPEEGKSKGVFNNGVAGEAKGVELRIEKRGDSDPTNWPLFKIYYKDSEGNELNEGYFVVNENYDENNKPKGGFLYALRKLVNLATGVINENYKFPVKETYEEILTAVMRDVHQASRNRKFNVLVSYGRKDEPKRFLEVPFFGSFIAPANSDKKLVLQKNAATERAEMDQNTTEYRQPKKEDFKVSNDSSNDLPF